jgi:hypothetical protein
MSEHPTPEQRAEIQQELRAPKSWRGCRTGWVLTGTAYELWMMTTKEHQRGVATNAPFFYDSPKGARCGMLSLAVRYTRKEAKYDGASD